MSTSTNVNAFTYNWTQSLTFLADNMRNVLREVIRENGLCPDKLMDDWDDIGRGVRTWLESRDLEKIIIEFYPPGSDTASARWDFPISYTGVGVDDDMWLDKNYLRQFIAKSKRPSPQDSYRVLLLAKPRRPYVPGLSDTPFKSTTGMSSYNGGMVIATGHLTASATYWR